MNVFAAVLITFAITTGCHGDQKEDTDAYLSRFIADLWLEGAEVVRIIWRDCSKKLVDVKDVIDHKEYFPKFVRCMKRKTLRALDRSLSPDIVPVADGVNLVRFELVDKTGNVMHDNNTNTWSEKELDEGEWRTLALQRMAKVLRTHVIKFDFENGKAVEKVEYRGRRRQQMMTMMMFGIVSIGMVMIPMGFQFLAVLGGKALLLAKMALILASIQGLKKVDPTLYPYSDRGKVAASPVNYGFYHSYPPYDHYEQRSNGDWSTGVMPVTPPPAMSIHNPWPLETGNIKIDRIHIAHDVKETTRDSQPEMKPQSGGGRVYPVYIGSSESFFSAIDNPAPLVDLTTKPGEVQADYSLDLPFNGFRFQGPTTVVSS